MPAKLLVKVFSTCPLHWYQLLYGPLYIIMLYTWYNDLVKRKLMSIKINGFFCL